MFYVFTSLVLIQGITQCSSQHLFPLQQFSKEIDSSVKDLENGAQIFVSSNESQQYLQNIYFISGDNSMSAYELSQRRVSTTSGQKQGWTISDTLTIKSANNKTISNQLQGWVYITTAAQAADPNFYVYDVVYDEVVDTTLLTGESTVVFFNIAKQRNDVYDPVHSAIISDIKQNNNIELHMSIPQTDRTYKTRCFSNPIVGNLGTPQFDNIEPLQIEFAVFHIVGNGYKFNVKSGFFNSTYFNTTALTTTGLVMRNFDEFARNVTVELRRDEAYNGTSGFQALHVLYAARTLTVSVATNDGSGVQTGLNGENLESALVYQSSDKVYISPSDSLMGLYCVQYFNTKGALLPSSSTTTPSTTSSVPSTSTVTIQSTTSFASTTTILFSFIVSLIYIL